MFDELRLPQAYGGEACILRAKNNEAATHYGGLNEESDMFLNFEGLLGANIRY